jgi:tetratricopeptide (TPR) repeat protein
LGILGGFQKLRSWLIAKRVRGLAQRFTWAVTALILFGVLIPPVRAATLEEQGQQASPGSYTGVNVEASPQVFSTMCALDAAGFGADESTLAEMPERLALSADLLKMQGPATEALRKFYREHTLADPGETLSRYLAFALVVGPPPDFQFQVDPDLLPPDVLALEGFQGILVNFYKEAHLDIRWARIEPEYERAAERYQGPLSRIVTLTHAYLREILQHSHGASFTIYVEPLAGARTTLRSFGDSYGVVVGTGSQLPIDDIQQAYLHFLLDPLPVRYREQVRSKSALLDIAAHAPRLPVEYQEDFMAFTDECLVKAVELRLQHPAPDALESALHEDDESGFILVRPLVQQLQKFEKSELSMPEYFPDLIGKIDVVAERKRLQSVTFAPATPSSASTFDESSSRNQASLLRQWLADGDNQIALQNGPAAAAVFEKVLEKYPNQPQAMYGLAIASVLSGQASRAKELFEELVAAPSPAAAAPPGSGGAANPEILAWSHVYLGRIHDLEGDRELAVGHYQAALDVEGAPESARMAAQQGIDAPYKSPARPNDNGTQQP